MCNKVAYMKVLLFNFACNQRRGFDISIAIMLLPFFVICLAKTFSLILLLMQYQHAVLSAWINTVVLSGENHIRLCCFLDTTVFTVNESVTDHHVTILEHLSINIHGATIHTFYVTTGSVTFEIKIYPNGTETKFKGFICVSVDMLTSNKTL
jgi:hypothetical protein